VNNRVEQGFPASGRGAKLKKSAVLCCENDFTERDVSEAGEWKNLEKKFAEALNFERRPVAVAFLDATPAGVRRFTGSEPSGCSFWRLAASGETFYTVPENHFNCAVGAYTHNIALSPEREQETGQTLKLMFDLGYVTPEEVPQIPRLEKAPVAIVYSPLGEAPVKPDVVLFACKPRAAMLLNETANRAGVASGSPALGRPTCMALPASLKHGAILSLGCIGNRVYTGLSEEELYFVVRGDDVQAMAEALEVVIGANTALREYADGRRETLASA
jgi:uncharacterized protein (DUF169 family)